MKYGTKGGKQSNSAAPTIANHKMARPSKMSKGDSRSKSGGASGVQKPKQGKY